MKKKKRVKGFYHSSNSWSIAYSCAGNTALEQCFPTFFTHGVHQILLHSVFLAVPRAKGINICILHSVLFMRTEECKFSQASEPEIGVHLLRNSSVFIGWRLNWCLITFPSLPWLLGSFGSNLWLMFDKVHETLWHVLQLYLCRISLLFLSLLIFIFTYFYILYYMCVCKLPYSRLGIHLCICPCVVSQLSQIDGCMQTYLPQSIYFFSNTAASHFNSVAPGKIFCTNHFCGYWKYQSRKIVVPILDVCPLPDLLSH